MSIQRCWAEDGEASTHDLTLTPTRSRNMAAIGRRDTRPERIVREIVTSLGYSFSTNDERLRGTPDLVLWHIRTVIMVHGCFWHRHGCPLTSTPRTRLTWWLAKFAATVRRAARVARALRRNGWSVLTVWQCVTRDREALARRLAVLLLARQRWAR